MSADQRPVMDEEIERLQGLLTALEGLSDPTAKAAARELVQVVLDLHALGLSDLLAIVEEADSQPADTLPAKFAANPRVRGLMLLHGLHPEDLPTRARHAVEYLRPHLGVKGVRAEFVGVEEGAVRIRISADGQKSRRPSAAELRREIEDTLWELAPDATELILDGLEATGGAREAYVPLSAIARAGAASAGG
ncbi:MAG: hypothetical protein ACRES9_10425 [Gammaproteobacteria bacterium]